jgi:FkbM family methyltransferase
MNILFDIGSNNGDRFINNTDDVVFAFEPVPELYLKILNKTRHLEHYHVFWSAVSNFNGFAEFHVSELRTWGASSLLEFKDYEEIEKSWNDRPDLRPTKKIGVPVIRLDTFIKNFNVERIDYLHIDAQGSDLNVLFSLGDSISIVREGCAEAPSSSKASIYKNQNYDILRLTKFLTENGFDIKSSHANDIDCNEYNLRFSR